MGNKDWIVKQWIKDKLNIKSPSMCEINRGYGQALAEGFAEGIKKKRPDIVDMSKLSTRDDHTVIDPLLDRFEQTVWDQQAKVLASGKYPHPIHKDNHTALEWIDHQMSEFADALVYHECMKQTIQDVIYLIGQAQEWNKETRADKSDIVDAILSDALARLRKG